MTNENTCNQCECSLTNYVDDLKTEIRYEGERECCCGDFDADGNYVDATCVACCAPNHVGRIWDGKPSGGGYFIVNPSF